MGFKIECGKKYGVEFVSFVNNKPNKIIVSPGGPHRKTQKQLEIFERKLKRKVDQEKQRCLLSSPNSAVDREVFVPQINDMVVVADPTWVGVRRAILLEKLGDDRRRFSVYLYDRGINHVCTAADISPVPKEFKKNRPAVYILTLEHVFPTKVRRDENKIDWVKGAIPKVRQWLSNQGNEDSKLCMSISCIINDYELVGDLLHYSTEGGVTTQDSLILTDFMLRNNVACTMLQFKRLLYLTDNEITDYEMLPKVVFENENSEKMIKVLRREDMEAYEECEFGKDGEEDDLASYNSERREEKISSPAARRKGIWRMPGRPDPYSIALPEVITEEERQQWMVTWGAEELLVAEKVEILVEMQTPSGSEAEDGGSISSAGYPRSTGSSDDLDDVDSGGITEIL